MRVCVWMSVRKKQPLKSHNEADQSGDKHVAGTSGKGNRAVKTSINVNMFSVPQPA